MASFLLNLLGVGLALQSLFPHLSHLLFRSSPTLPRATFLVIAKAGIILGMNREFVDPSWSLQTTGVWQKAELPQTGLGQMAIGISSALGSDPCGRWAVTAAGGHQRYPARRGHGSANRAWPGVAVTENSDSDWHFFSHLLANGRGGLSLTSFCWLHYVPKISNLLQLCNAGFVLSTGNSDLRPKLYCSPFF